MSSLLRAGLDTGFGLLGGGMPASPVLQRSLTGKPAGLSSCRVSFHAAAAVAILLLSACADKLPIPSADTSCERFRHISATPAQIKVYQDNWEVMESYADQVVSHNLEYDKSCLGVAP